jgi:tRNA dimethylallyltransferase
MKKYLIMIIGPTAVGKTDVAINVAQHLSTEIVSADSRQIYREIPVGTAAPDAHQSGLVKHHLVGHRSIHEYYNVSIYEKEALSVISKIFEHNDQVVLTGGSGLYAEVLEKGIDDLPDVSPELRERLKDEYNAKGIGWLREEVARIDPVYYDEVDHCNPNRLLRALEVFESTALKFSDLRTSKRKERPFDFIKIGLDRPRPELDQRIHQRADSMIADGLLDECRAMLPYEDLNALNTVGYKELFPFLKGECTIEEAVEKLKTSSRRYARRQLTWFRRDQEIRWFHPDDMNDILEWIDHRIGDIHSNV